MQFLLDTNIIVDFFREKPRSDTLLKQLLKQGAPSISIITYAELLYGTYRSRDQRYEQQRVEEFLRDFLIRIVPLDAVMIVAYAKAKFFLEKEGNRPDEFDLLIGATAATLGYTLVTHNAKHFNRFPELLLYQDEQE